MIEFLHSGFRLCRAGECSRARQSAPLAAHRITEETEKIIDVCSTMKMTHNQARLLLRVLWGVIQDRVAGQKAIQANMRKDVQNKPLGVYSVVFTEDLKRLAGLIKDNWSLCQIMEGCGPRASEKEYMIAETIRAAARNLETRGEPFSFRGDGVYSYEGGGLVDNATAYGYLLTEGYFEERERPDITDVPEGIAKGKAVVIYPTRKLLDKLIRHFADK
jgi:hypothetical protein